MNQAVLTAFGRAGPSRGGARIAPRAIGDHVTSPPDQSAAPAAARLRRIWTDACADDWVRVLLATALVGSVLAVAGGFGTGAMPLPGRLAYWLSLVVIGVLLGRIGGRRLIRRPWFAARPATAVGLLTLMIGLPITVIAAASNALFRGRAFHLDQIGEVLPSVLLTTAGMIVLAFMVQARAVAETRAAPPGAPPVRFLGRLPAALADASLWAVEAQDHYLRVHTSKGAVMILMRLVDALEELEGVEGARTHRSWWVAREAVTKVERGDGRATLTLANGLAAPVSRGYLKTLREAGWF